MRSNRHFFFSLFLICFTGWISGQELHFAMTSDTLRIITPVPGQQVSDYLTSSLSNPGNGELTVDIIRVQNDLPVQWSSALCIDVCHFPFVDSTRVSIAPGSQKEFKMYFGFLGDGYASLAHTRILVRNVDDPENSFFQDYYGQINGELSLSENGAAVAFSLFPNPLKDQLIIFPEEDADFFLCDLQGKELLSQKLEAGQQKILYVGFLNAGVYMYELRTQNKVRAQGKLMKD